MAASFLVLVLHGVIIMVLIIFNVMPIPALSVEPPMCRSVAMMGSGTCCSSLTHHNNNRSKKRASCIILFATIRNGPDGIEYQWDDSKYGRGEMHLSAMLDVGDIVVYQTGTWLVDGVEVGDGGPPDFQYGLVETIQLVWTHNCEHGVIRALPLKLLIPKEENGHSSSVLCLESDDCREFGPETALRLGCNLRKSNSPFSANKGIMDSE